MQRFSSLLKGNKSHKNEPARSYSGTDFDNAPVDSPEGIASRAVRLFCESGGENNRDEEVLHLPTIVDAAESSPLAAAACATQIRTFMSKKDMAKPHVQYNAIMLIRILSDNPGSSFTKNFDDKFVKSTKTMLRDCKDQSVQQLLRETLDTLEVNRPQDAGLEGLITMWRKEKGMSMRQNTNQRVPYGGASLGSPPPMVHNQSRPRNQLPSAAELASRVEEARNTAKILLQLLQKTPTEEIGSNELIKEFADRCQTASRSMQTYINSEHPGLDDDTLQTLIETNEQLSLANSRHQRAVLASRRALGTSPASNDSRNASITATNGVLNAPPQLPQLNGFGGLNNEHSLSTYPQSYIPPVSPPTSYVNSAASPTSHANSAVSPNLGHARPAISPPVSSAADDYDDMYDSPRAARTQERNPFQDPAESSPPLASNNLYGQQYVRPASPPRSISPPRNASPQTSRPTPAPWHNSGVTPSYLGRQASAVNGFTMHAPGTPDIAEIDGHSDVGRTDYHGSRAPQSFVVTHPPSGLSSK